MELVVISFAGRVLYRTNLDRPVYQIMEEDPFAMSNHQQVAHPPTTLKWHAHLLILAFIKGYSMAHLQHSSTLVIRILEVCLKQIIVQCMNCHMTIKMEVNLIAVTHRTRMTFLLRLSGKSLGVNPCALRIVINTQFATSINVIPIHASYRSMF